MLGWHVIHSKPQKETWLYNQLNALQIEVYYPCLRVRYGRTYSYKSRPYFPSYLFVNIDINVTGKSMLQWIPGSLGLVTFGGEPACIPEGLIWAIRHHVDEINSTTNKIQEGLRAGDEVVIHSGPFAGYNAIFCSRLHDNERAEVFLKVLQDQAIRINLPLCTLAIK